MLIREKNKLNLKSDTANFFKDIQYNGTSSDQKFYDKEFRTFHLKLVAFIGILLTGIFFLILNGKSIWNWLAS